MMSIVLHCDLTKKLRAPNPLELRQTFRKGIILPAMSKIEVKVFSKIMAFTCEEMWGGKYKRFHLMRWI